MKVETPVIGPVAAILLLLVGACVVTGVVVRAAWRWGWIDVPNERSSHARPTPRGGGVSIVLVTLLTVAFLLLRGDLPPVPAIALLVGGACVATLGGLDDRYRLGNVVRLVVWGGTAVTSALLLGGLPQLDLGVWVVPLGVSGVALLAVAIVWSINLYNFMDGIDGLAGSQAVTAAAAGGAMLLAAGEGALAWVAFAVAASSAGFLFWNWSPARIFMGDVASGFLGFVFVLLAVLSERGGGPPIVAWAILLGPFLVDATFTVARRTLRGEAFYRPHRTHAFQLALRRGLTHRQVTLRYLTLDLLLVPVAAAAWLFPIWRLPLAILVLGALGLLWGAEVRRDRARLAFQEGTGMRP